MTNDELNDYDDDDDDVLLDDHCPNCHAEYDEIDYEYQICHYCGFNNVTEGGGHL